MKMTILTYRTIIQKDDKYYHGSVPALPGCHTQGVTIEETQKNLEEAMIGWITSRRELGWPVPEDDLIETLQTVRIPENAHSLAAYV